MYRFCVEIAGVPVEISAAEAATHRFLSDYLTENAPAFSVSCTEEERTEELALQRRMNEKSGDELYSLTAAGCEVQVILRKIAEGLVRHGVLLMHGSALALDGEGFIFTAPSGTGKSTHARLWREAFGERVVMINDDKPFVKVTDEDVFVCGNPWQGKHNLGGNLTAPLRGIAFLNRAGENAIARVSLADYIPEIMRQSYRSENAGTMAGVFSLLSAIGERVPVWRLECNMEPDAARVAAEGMRGIK